MLVVGEIVKVRDLELSESSNKSPVPLLDGPATSQHVPALLSFESFVTTTPTMHVRAAKALFDGIMQNRADAKGLFPRAWRKLETTLTHS